MTEIEDIRAQRSRLADLIGRFVHAGDGHLTDREFFQAVHARWDFDQQFVHLVDPNE